MSHEATLSKLQERFATDRYAVSEFRDNFGITCDAQELHEVLSFLKAQCGFDMLVDVTAVDYLEYNGARDRFGVVYALVSTATNERLFVKAMVNDPDPSLPSAVQFWNSANWLEREVYDMFGIRFESHPDL